MIVGTVGDVDNFNRRKIKEKRYSPDSRKDYNRENGI